MPSSTEDPNSPRALMLAAIPRLRRFAVSMTGSHHEGDDLTQLALEKGLANLGRWTPGTKMESWLLRIAYNSWIDEVRSRKRRGAQLDLDVAGELSGADGRDIAHARLDLEAVHTAMADLPDEQRAVLALVALDGMSYQEAADTLKIPIGTVMSRLSRARKTLSERLNNAGVADD